MADVSKALNVVRKLNPMGFFSRAAEAANEIPQAKGTGEQMRKMLLDRKGVKAEELKWTGFDDWAKGKKSVTRDEVTEFLRRNEVQLGEKRLSGKEEYGKWEPEAEGVIGDVRQVNVNPNPTKFEQYTLPGGKDYNELLLTRPTPPAYSVKPTENGNFILIDNATGEPAKTPNGQIVPPFSSERQANDIAQTYSRAVGDEKMRETGYRSSHWDDPNVLAHMRMVGRTDPEGRRVLHLEELQSDWAQEGRKKGFRSETSNADLVKQYDALNAERRQLHSNIENGVDVQQSQERLASVQTNMERMSDQMAVNRSAPPTAPFVESTPGWTNLALKRAMIEAARGNYDAIAWTPGAEQAKRFDLSKQIDDIRYAPSADGRTVSLEAYRGGENIFNQTNMPIAKLDEFVGRDIAERIAKGVGETDPNTGYRVLSGLDLQVGGEGMKGYYDKILPTQIGKVLKDINETPQFGTVNISNPARPSTSSREVDDLYRELAGEDPPAMVGGGSWNLPSLAITPAMREKINQGLPLFTMMPAAVGLGATASQMQEGQNPAVEGEGFADGGKIVRKALEAVRGLPKAVGLEEFMPAAGERRLPKAVGLEEFMRGAGERRLPSTPSIEEFMPAAREHRLPDAVGLEEFMPAAREPRLPEAVGLEEFMPIDRAGGGKVVGEALQAIRRNRENGGPVDMRAGEMIGLRARLGLSPRKITDRAGPIHTDPAVAAARDAAVAEETPAVVEQALDVVRSQPRQPVAARPLTIPAPRSAPPEPSESQRLWQLYNESENPADFVRADEAMRAERADGGRLLEDQYPTQYLPDVGRQVMQDGGAPEDFVSAQGRRRATLEGLGGFEDRPVMDPATMGQNWASAVQRFRERPLREGETVARPLELGGRDILGGAIAGDGGTVRGRVADLLVGSRGLPGSGTAGFGLADFTPAGVPLAVSDMSDALRNQDYVSAALSAAGPAAYYARKPIMAAGRAVYDAGRRAVDVAGDVLGRVPAPITAAGAGAAAMTPEEAEAAGKSKMVQQVLDTLKRFERTPSTKDPRFYHDISSTKLSRPIDEMRAEYDPVGPAFQVPVRKPADYEGKAFVTAFGDPSVGGVNLLSVNDKKLVKPTLMQAGPSFVYGAAARGPDRSIWASDLPLVSGLTNRAAAAQKAGYEPFLNYVKMGGESPDYSHHITDPLLDLFRQSKVSKDIVSDFDRKMREGFSKDFPAYANWPGLRSKKLDDYLFETGPGKARTAMAKLMATGYFQKLGMPDVGAVRFAATDPDLLNVPSYTSGRMIARMDPTAKAIRNPAVPHKTYRAQLSAHPEGADPSRFAYDVPLEISHKDYVDRVLAEKPNLNPSQLQFKYSKDAPTLYMTPQTVDRMSTFLDLKQRGLIP